MSVEKQLKATSGYGMLVAVIAALLAIVGLFIWSLAGIAGTPERRSTRPPSTAGA